MQLLDLLLFDGANRNRLDAFATMCFENGFGVDAIGLTATAIRFNILCGNDFDLMSDVLCLSRPIVCGAAGFHQN